nr:diacylglycerol kinase family lipid kinase [bacterium]
MLYIIANPFAGRGRSKGVVEEAEKVLQARGAEYVIKWTEEPKQATQLARQALEMGYDTIVACGGDGTVNEVAAALVGTDAKLGILAGGTGNDYMKGNGIPKDMEQSIDTLLRGNTRKCDVGVINGRTFLNVTACGINMDLVEVSIGIKKYFTGLIAYVLSVLAVLRRFRMKRVRIGLDGGEAKPYNIVVCNINNAEFFAGGMNPTPGADPTDGLFNVAIVHDCSRLKVLFMLPKYVKGKHVLMKDICDYVTAGELVIESEEEIPFEVDGERGPVCKPDQPLHITMLPGAIRVVVP